VARADDFAVGGAEGGLDLIGVDQTSEIGVGHDVLGKFVSALLLGLAIDSAVDVVQAIKSTLGPDNEATNMSTRSQLQQVEALHLGQVNTGQVAECLGDSLVFVVHNKGAQTLHVTTVAHLSLSGTKLSGGLDLLDISVSSHGLQRRDGLLGLLQTLSGCIHHKGHFRELSDLVSSSQHQRREGRSSQGRRNRVALLVGVDLAMPLAPDASGGEHAALAAHVSKSTLASTRSTTARHSWNTGHGTTSSPGLSGVLVSCLSVDSVRLTSILPHVRVHELNDIGANGGQEHIWQSGLGWSIAIPS